jgi:glycosyltransferase involved in cell wall biosynthesis
MRILLAGHRSDAPGIATVMSGLTNALPAALDARDELVALGGAPGPSPAGARVVHRPVRLSRTHGRYVRFAYEQTLVPWLARRADIVHLGDCRPLLLSERPFVVTVHDLFFLDMPAWQTPSVRRFKIAMLRAAIAKGPAAVVCVSEYTRSRLLAHVPRARELPVRVIHPGIAPASEPVRWQGDEPYFLTLSEINPRKNLLTLLRSFQLARRRGLTLRWKIAGPPAFRSSGMLAALRSADGVDVLGHVSDGMREALFRDAAFMAFPSHAEGFGLPPLEAMARGVPTVCSTGTAMDETVVDAALRVGAEDVPGWTDALLRLERDDALRRELAERGAERAGTFSLARMAREHVELYRAVVDRGGIGSASASRTADGSTAP